MKKKGFQRGNEQSAAGHDARWGEREVRDAGEPAPAPRKPFPPPSVAFITPPSTEVHSQRPLQLVPLLRTTRWRLTRATPQYVYQPHQPRQPGSHRRSSLPPDFLHRCARLARTHAQLAAGCAVGQAGDEAATAATANDAPSTTAQVLAARASPGYAAPGARTRHAVCPQASWTIGGHRCARRIMMIRMILDDDNSNINSGG